VNAVDFLASRFEKNGITPERSRILAQLIAQVQVRSICEGPTTTAKKGI